MPAGFEALDRRLMHGHPSPEANLAGWFEFLDAARDLGQPVNWTPEWVPQLWRYHLHYFDHLTRSGWDPGLAFDWVRANPPGRGTGWEPYPLSRRIPNWILSRLRSGASEAWADQSLACQAESLSRQVEYHLLGNHLLANLRALLFAGCYFSGPVAGRWLGRALAEWNLQLERQLLADGGHEERSPMYHALLLADLVDLIALADTYPGVIPAGSVDLWKAQAARMLGWLLELLHPDGEIAFFQDAAVGMAPAPKELLTACASLGVRPQRSALDRSGYVRLAAGDAMLLADLGVPGPAHQPGHAHAGALSFELSRGAQRVLVNSGTSTYEPGAGRDHERSTLAHNTFCDGKKDQSEMWAAFRVGARARLVARERWPDGAEAAIEDAAGVVLCRRFEADRGGYRIRDVAATEGARRIDWAFHLHPSVRAVFDSGAWRLRTVGGETTTLRLDPALTSVLQPCFWSPRFGQRIPSLRIHASWQGRGPAEFHHSLVLS